MVEHGDDVVARLANAQLNAYNRSDLGAFCDCYSEDVTVLDERGEATLAGKARFRESYRDLFDAYRDVRAVVERRFVLGRHAVDYERWERVSRETGEAESGVVLVRYTERDGKIAIVEFLR